jgi:glutamate formiminotransferase/formiminotetrahydrofolate cyclodeaminase
MGLVESIMNFSEGRRADVVAAISAAIGAVAGVQLLDVQSDSDHNRTVISFAGPANAVGEAAFQATKIAQGQIDLNAHQGAHPRLGATDVVPFVPLGDTPMAECVALAREVGRRIGDELGIAVYLYEEAATRPERRNLADVRRGEYEAWRDNVASDPARQPDFGPAQATPAGATVVGARQPLIAYNVYLSTSDVEIARKIAKVVRFLGGGLRYVKALGLLVDGRAQISMNLVNYRGTPIHRVVELIRSEAARYGVSVTESEVVGLVPQDALLDAAEHYLQLNAFRREQVLEQKLAAGSSDEGAGEVSWLPTATLRSFAAGTPVPGGGSAAALAGALAASLGQMVANLTVGRKKYVLVEETLRAVLARLETASRDLTRLAAEDSAAFAALMSANKLPQDTPEQASARDLAVQAATSQAIQVPLAVVQRAVALLDDLAVLATQANPNARTDAQVGAYLAHAAAHGAGLNVLVNLDGVQDATVRDQLTTQIHTLRTAAETGLQKVLAAA